MKARLDVALIEIKTTWKEKFSLVSKIKLRSLIDSTYSKTIFYLFSIFLHHLLCDHSCIKKELNVVKNYFFIFP